MLDRGEDLDGMTLRATVPVNLWPLEHACKLGNHFGVPGASGGSGQSGRSGATRFRVHEWLKKLAASHCCIGTSCRTRHGTDGRTRVALELFSRKATAGATNVPCPQQPLYMAGSGVRDMMFWVPQTGSIGVGLPIMSYNGRVHFGLIADAKLIPDPDAVVQCFGAEFDKLVYLA